MQCRPALLLASTLMSLPAMAEAQALPPDEPAAGISRELAAWRSAHYRSLRYGLRLRLLPAIERVQGQLTLRFAFRAQPVDVVLDWRPSAIDALPPAAQAACV